MRIKSFKEWWTGYKGSAHMHVDLFLLGVAVGHLLSGNIGMFIVVTIVASTSLFGMISFKEKTKE